MDLDSMKYAELRSLAKELGLKANMKVIVVFTSYERLNVVDVTLAGSGVYCCRLLFARVWICVDCLNVFNLFCSETGR